MDPEATLSEALRSLTYLNFEACSKALEEYRWWRRCGGDEPERGDARHDQILQDLRAISNFGVDGVFIARPTNNLKEG